VSSALDAIRKSHEAHEARVAAAAAVRGVEVVVYGSVDADVLQAIGERLVLAGGQLGPTLVEATRYAVAGEGARPEDLVRASEAGVTIVAPQELDAMLEAYMVVTGTRARRERLKTMQAEAHKQSKVSRMHTRG
jgi:NAD-dependent DNA ligase